MVILGLIFNFVGSLLLVIGTSLLTDVITGIIDTIAEEYGTWSMENIPAEQIQSFRRRKTISKWINVIGYALFGVGFLLQLIPQFQTCN